LWAVFAALAWTGAVAFVEIERRMVWQEGVEFMNPEFHVIIGEQ